MTQKPEEHPRVREVVRTVRANGGDHDLAAQIAIADAVNRLADATQRIANVAEIAGRMLTDPLAVVTMARQIEQIGKNLDRADQQHRIQEATEDFERVLGMTDAELAS